MPSSIPYDPSLVLGNVVNNDALVIVEQISQAQAPADAAQEALNALLASRRSLDMTKTELINLGIGTGEIDDAVKGLNENITSSAADYCKAKIAAENQIKDLRAKIRSVHATVESPLDYVQTQIKTLPLAADSLSMDVQYFSRDSNEQNSASFANAVSGFVSASTSWMGIDKSAQISTAAKTQVSKQMQHHDIEGTLVLSASCTHRNAAMLAPFILNVDKGIKVWNRLFPDEKLDLANAQAMTDIAGEVAKSEDKRFSIISGMTSGSSFVGMVHILNSTDTTVSDRLSSYSSTLQAQMSAGGWFANLKGGFGVDESIGDNVKNLLSSQNVTSHVTMICMGVIPSIVASDVTMAVKEFTEFNPKASMDAICELQNKTSSSQNSVKDSAQAARTGKQMMVMRENDIKSALSALKDTDKATNKVLDTNSMMTALDDYLKKAAAGDCGVPINYYLKDITKDMLAEMWVAKYYPGKYLAITYDDHTPEAGGSGSGGDAGGS